MKKIVVLILCLILCGCTKTDARYEVESYLNKFKNHDEAVISSLNDILDENELDSEDKELYELVMKRQYTDLEYKVKEERYNGDIADITVLIKVYDYEKSKNEALEEINNSSEYDSEEKKIHLVLKKMDEENKRIEYTIEFKVNYQDDKWVLEKPDKTVLEKIHGIYDYEED